jgi:alpha-galactosidase
MKISLRELNKLLQSGWQSWSIGYSEKNIGSLPTFLHPSQPVDLKKSLKLLETLKLPCKLKKSIKGWCSYYTFGTKVTEQNILDQVKVLKAKKLAKFNYILIDDGWERHWGDWLESDRKKFPHGLKKLANQIKKNGFKPGIWLAPFLVSPQSKIAQQHPDWLIQVNGKPIDGFKLTPFDHLFKYKKYLLDLENKAVRRHLDRVFAWLIDDCGFELLKLDYLCAGHFEPGVSTDIADDRLRNFLAGIKKKYPKIYTIGCGCPLIPAIGVIDSMRIALDTLFLPVQTIPWVKTICNRINQNLILKNLSARKWTKKYWRLDPDVFLCHNKFGFTDRAKIIFQQKILALQGSIFLGDDLTQLTDSEIKQFIWPLR